MDHGEPGLQHTLTLLESIKVPHVGAGKDLKESCSFTVLEKDDIRVGVFGVAEHEFSIATETCAGANPFNPLRTGDFIKQQKQELRLNAIIILFHGGKEYYRYPSPGLQANCRHLVEKGADLVVCQHSHCVGAYEHYLDGDIIYGQGNFIFDTKHVISSESVLISYEIQKEQPGKITYIPIMRNISNHGSVTLAEGAEGESICAAMKARSIEITHPGFLEEAYRNFSQKQISAYLRIASPFGMWFERVDKRLFNGRLIRALYKQNKTMRLMNVIRCESHRELFLEGLDVLHRNRKDS
jgi:poly-gamma-glutamate synthesis protein (capsule biosynthesis protein)